MAVVILYLKGCMNILCFVTTDFSLSIIVCTLWNGAMYIVCVSREKWMIIMQENWYYSNTGRKTFALQGNVFFLWKAFSSSVQQQEN